MCARHRGAAGVARVLQALGTRIALRPTFSSYVPGFVRIVTDSLRRSSRVVSIGLGAAGVALASTLYLSHTVSGTVALAIAAYALACGALTHLLGEKADKTAPEVESTSSSISTPSSVNASAAAPTSAPLTGTTAPTAGDETPHQSSTPDLRDPLTGLANRLLFRDRVEHGLARAHRHERPVAVMLLDIMASAPLTTRSGMRSATRCSRLSQLAWAQRFVAVTRRPASAPMSSGCCSRTWPTKAISFRSASA